VKTHGTGQGRYQELVAQDLEIVMKYGNWTLGQTEALINKLGGIENALGILQGNIRLTTERIFFPVWTMVEIGGVPKEQLVPTLESEGLFVGDWGKDMIKQDAFTVLPEKKLLKLARCTVRDLGFTEVPTTTQLKEAISRFGGQLCPAEVGPHLRRQLKDQANGDCFWLVMEQIMDSDGNPSVFGLHRHVDGKQWLVAGYATPDDRWNLGRVVVFVLAI